MLKSPLARADAQLRSFALSFPEAVEEFPWGHSAFKVKGKVFLFLACDDKALSMSVKLPRSNMMALALPFAAPTGYGLGKSGWVSARFEAGQDAPVPLLEEWIMESFRAVAPKTIARRLESEGLGAPKKSTKPAAAKSVSKKTTKRGAPKPVAKKTTKTAAATKPVTKKTTKRGAAKPVAKKTTKTAAATKSVAKKTTKRGAPKPVAKKIKERH